VEQFGAGCGRERVEALLQAPLKLVWAHVAGDYLFAVTMISATVERTSASVAPASTQVAQTSRAVEVFMSLAEFALASNFSTASSIGRSST
jgi:hypothetical protein